MPTSSPLSDGPTGKRSKRRGGGRQSNVSSPATPQYASVIERVTEEKDGLTVEFCGALHSVQWVSSTSFVALGGDAPNGPRGCASNVVLSLRRAKGRLAGLSLVGGTAVFPDQPACDGVLSRPTPAYQGRVKWVSSSATGFAVWNWGGAKGGDTPTCVAHESDGARNGVASRRTGGTPLPCAMTPSGNMVLRGGLQGGISVYTLVPTRLLQQQGATLSPSSKDDTDPTLGLLPLSVLEGHRGRVNDIDIAIPPISDSLSYIADPVVATARRACPLLVASVGVDKTLRVWRIFDAKIDHGFGSRRNNKIEEQNKTGAMVAYFHEGLDSRYAGMSWVFARFALDGRRLFTVLTGSDGLSVIRCYKIKVTGDTAALRSTSVASEDGASPPPPGVQLMVKRFKDYTMERKDHITCLDISDSFMIYGTEGGTVSVRNIRNMHCVFTGKQFLGSPVVSVSLSRPTTPHAALYLTATDSSGTLRIKEVPKMWHRVWKAILVLFLVIAMMRLFELRILAWA